jgi:hypothetical protein
MYVTHDGGVFSGVEVTPETVGQYVPRENEKSPLYVGDIITDEIGVRYVVRYDDRYTAFVLCDFESSAYMYEDVEVSKIIGNIHDNPALLDMEA